MGPRQTRRDPVGGPSVGLLDSLAHDERIAASLPTGVADDQADREARALLLDAAALAS